MFVNKELSYEIKIILMKLIDEQDFLYMVSKLGYYESWSGTIPKLYK